LHCRKNNALAKIDIAAAQVTIFCHWGLTKGLRLDWQRGIDATTRDGVRTFQALGRASGRQFTHPNANLQAINVSGSTYIVHRPTKAMPFA